MSRKVKRQKSATHYRIPDAYDHEILHARTETTGSRNQPITLNRSPGKGRTQWNEQKQWEPEDSKTFGVDNDASWYNAMVDGHIFDDKVMDHGASMPEMAGGSQGVKKKKKRRRTTKEWQEKHRETFLKELLRQKGRGDFRLQAVCMDCMARGLRVVSEKGHGQAEYRCRDCFGGDMVCKTCCVKRHRNNPFHWIERWTGVYFERIQLRELGLFIQLNHNGGDCDNPAQCHSRTRILHTNGIHEVDLRFCGCAKKALNGLVPQHIQLLRRQLYPATVKDGRILTIATFQYLDMLEVLGYTSKASTYDFYRGMERLSDNKGLKEKVRNSRYLPLLAMIRQWRHLKMVLRGGGGHAPEGLDGLRDGALAVPCPSCPHPGINLPFGWETEAADEGKGYLYRAAFCIDANFRLKEQLVSSHKNDPSLTGGLGYFVKREEYENWTDDKGEADQMSSCVSFAAISKQNTKFSKGLRYTGVGGVVCGRSDMFIKVGNLKKGERYSNMDYIVASALATWPGWLLLLAFLLVYDIACQWTKNLFIRARSWPSNLRLPPEATITPAIGKLHLPGHKEKDHEQYNLNLIPGAAQIDGESCERVWGPHNILGNSTRTMGPGARQDSLEGNFAWWNWDKYIGMGETLRTGFKNAVKDRNEQAAAQEGLTENLPPDLVKEWEAMCTKWEKAPYPKGNTPNPYAVPEERISISKALKELAETEEENLRGGGVSYHQVAAPGYIMLVLEAQDAQRKISEMVQEHRKDPTSVQSTKVLDQRNALRRRLRDIQVLQAIYMPGLVQFLLDGSQVAEDEEEAMQPESIKLWLPSDIPKEKRVVVLVKGLEEVEQKLQEARCYDSLNAIRHTLRIKARLMQFKNKNVRGQRESGRSRAVINRVYKKARRFASRYRQSRNAYLRLMGPGEWEKKLRVLEDADVRSYRDPALVKTGIGRQGTSENEETESAQVSHATGIQLIAPDRMEWAHRTVHGTGETRKEHSWIWTSGGKINVEDGAEGTDNHLLRSEWCRSRARVKRAQEEVQLVKEEMRRTLAFLSYRANEWQSWKMRWSAVGKELPKGSLVEGMDAYAAMQQALQLRLRDSFEKEWKKPLEEETLGTEEKDEEAEKEGLEVEDGEPGLQDMDGKDDEDEDEDEDEIV